MNLSIMKSKKNKDRIIVKIVKRKYIRNLNLGYEFNSFFFIAIG